MVDMLKDRLKNDDVDVNTQNETGWTPLHYAAEHNYVECVKLLLGVQNIDVNIKNKDGRTPLHISVFLLTIKCVKVLLAHQDIDVNIRDVFYDSPLSLASRSWIPNADEIASLLLEYDAIPDPSST